jgi:hypothetical protein
MRRHHFGLARGFAAATCVAALAACSSGSSTGNKSSGGLPPQAVQSEVAASVASSISSEISAMTTDGFTPFLGFFNRVSPGGNNPALNLAQRMAKKVAHARDFGPDCPALTPADPVDTDLDGIFDSFTETFGNDCSEDGETISGSLSISDPTPDTPDLAYNATIDNLDITDVDSDLNVSIGINGSLGVTETLSSIGVNANYTYNFAETEPDAITEAVTEKLTSTYTFPATSTLLTEATAIPLPPGTFSVSGQDSFTINNTTYAFAISTPTPLTVDANSCPTGVTSGVVSVSFSGQGASGTVTITWTACGAYTISN